MRTNYVLIDYENVQPKNLSLLQGDHFRVVVFIGGSQRTISTELAVALQPFGDRARYLQICGNGRNALDFHIAYFMGRIASDDSRCYMHVISRDTGFDPLITHLRQAGLLAKRAESIEALAEGFASSAKSPSALPGAVPTEPSPDRSALCESLIPHLKKMARHLPAREEALRASIANWMRKAPRDAQQRAYDELVEKGIVRSESGKLRYSLPG